MEQCNLGSALPCNKIPCGLAPGHGPVFANLCCISWLLKLFCMSYSGIGLQPGKKLGNPTSWIFQRDVWLLSTTTCNHFALPKISAVCSPAQGYLELQSSSAFQPWERRFILLFNKKLSQPTSIAEEWAIAIKLG